jgi:CHAT domain-containing protein/Flp pilus assembly protein TadD
MGHSKRLMVLLLASLWAMPGALAPPPAQAEIVANTETGGLDETSPVFPDNEKRYFYQTYTLAGTAGESVVIDLLSPDFNAFLLLADSDGNWVASDDDSGGGTQARLTVTLPRDGSYEIWVTTSAANEIGTYELRWRSANAAELALQRAAQLSHNALHLEADGQIETAIAQLTEAVALYRQYLSPNHPLLAEPLGTLGRLYHAQENYEAAEASFQGALRLYRRQGVTSQFQVAVVLSNLAELYRDLGRFTEADALYPEALATFRAQLGPRHLTVATVLNNRGLLYGDQGRYGEAEALLQTALEIRREQLGDRHLDVANSLSGLAINAYNQGRYAEAESYYQECLAILRSQLGASHVLVGVNENGLGALYYNQGRYDEAEALLLNAIDIFRAQSGTAQSSLASALNNLALLYQDQGRYREAEPIYEAALGLNQALFGERHAGAAAILDNLAALYNDQGRYGEAIALYEQALAIRREQLGNSHPEVALNLNGLAITHLKQGDYDQVEPLLQAALTIGRQQFGENHPEVALTLGNLAVLYRSQGRLAEAEPLFQATLAIWRDHLGDNHPSVGTALNNLAWLYMQQQRYAEAIPLYREALTIVQASSGADHPNAATTLSNLAILHGAQGNSAEATAALAAGMAIEERNLDLNLAVLAEAQRQSYAATVVNSTNLGISLHLQQDPASTAARQLALTQVLRRKGRILDTATDSRQALRANLSPAEQTQLDQLDVLRSQLANLIFSPPSSLTPEQYRLEVEQLRDEEQALSVALARQSATFRAETEPVTLAAVQAEIPEHGVLIEFVRYQPFDFETYDWQGDRYAAYLLFADGSIQGVDLGAAETVNLAVQQFNEALRRVNVSPTDASRTLASLIWDPLTPYLQDTEQVLLSPDGQLNRIPFEALQTEQGAYLISQYPLSYLNSGRDLLKFAASAPSQSPAVIMADPNYDTSAGHSLGGVEGRSSDLSDFQVGPLPGTAAEAAAIAPLLPNATVLTGDDASESALKQVQAPQILHIATHGFFLTDLPRLTSAGRGLGVIAGGDVEFRTAPEQPLENPLLRSGLALAGFNQRSDGTEDGVFTALEAAGLNLVGTQLVVLSACETGLGAIANGEGVYGLRRAFAIAGAETQLISLWQVDDFATQGLMVAYYEQLLADGGRAESLRQVQLELLNSDGPYAHPYYWAAFIVSGNWQPLD